MTSRTASVDPDEYTIIYADTLSAHEGIKMKMVVIESPLSGDFERNVRYAKLCMLDCLVNHEEAPYASHLLYTQCLDDDVHEQRRLGMEAGFVWGLAAEKRVVYTDLGESRGMKEGVAKATENGQVVEYRQLPSELLKRLDDNDDDLGATEGFKVQKR